MSDVARHATPAVARDCRADCLLSEAALGLRRPGTWIIGAVVAGVLLAMTQEDPSHPPQMPSISVLLAACVLSPLIEEMLFRGALQPLIRHVLAARSASLANQQSYGLSLPNFVTSIMFAACHGVHHELNLTVMSGLILASTTLGFLKDRGVELPVLVFIHSIWNFAFVLAISTKFPT